MVLSEKVLDELVACTRASLTMGAAARRAAARDAVRAAAKELGFDADAPPIPAMTGGDESLDAAVRVLKLSRAAKEVELHGRQQAALKQLEQRYAALERRRNELRIVELDRLRESVKAGRVPEPASQKLRDELDAIRKELATLANPDYIGSLLPYRSDVGIISDALTEDEWLAVTLYLHLSRRARARAGRTRGAEQPCSPGRAEGARSRARLRDKR